MNPQVRYVLLLWLLFSIHLLNYQQSEMVLSLEYAVLLIDNLVHL